MGELVGRWWRGVESYVVESLNSTSANKEIKNRNKIKPFVAVIRPPLLFSLFLYFLCHFLYFFIYVLLCTQNMQALIIYI